MWLSFVIIPPCRQLSHIFLSVAQPGCHRNCSKPIMHCHRLGYHLLRTKSTWITSETLIHIFKSLKDCLAPWIPEYKPLLLLDCAGAHLPKAVMRAARGCGIQLVYIPSCTTGLIQPLDCFSFSSFKMFLRHRYQKQREVEFDGQPQPLSWMWHLSQAPKLFFASRKWAPAFKGVGVADSAHLHSHLSEFMQRPDASSFPMPVKPTSAAFEIIWPRRRKMSYAYKLLL